MKNETFYETYTKDQLLGEVVVKDTLYNVDVEIKDVDEFITKMIDKFINCKKGINLEKDDNEDYLALVGSTILEKRLLKKLTQTEVSKGICSVSYISNLESNKYVKINNGFIYEICEKLEINYVHLRSIKPRETIEKIYSLYLNKDCEGINKLCNSLQNTIFVPSEEMVKAFNYLLMDNLSEFKDIMMHIDDIKKTLNSNEVIFMLFIMTVYFVKEMKFRKAYAYLILINRFEIKNKSLRILVLEMMYYVKGNLQLPEIDFDYSKLKVYFENDYPFSSQFKLRLQKAMFKPEESLEYINSINYNSIFDEYKKDYIYVKSYILIMNGKYLESLDTLIDYNSNEPKFIALYGMGTLFLQRNSGDANKKLINEYKNKFLDMCKNILGSVDLTIHLAFIELMKYELEKADEKFICDYIKQRMIYCFQTYQYLPYKIYVDSRYFYLTGKLARYKDSYTYAMDNEMFLKNSDIYCIINSIKR